MPDEDFKKMKLLEHMETQHVGTVETNKPFWKNRKGNIEKD